MKASTIRKSIYGVLFSILVLIGGLLIVKDIKFDKFSIIVTLTFCINIVVIFKELLHTSSLGYSLKDIVYLYMFLFMGVSPIIQYITNSFPWWDTWQLTDDYILSSNITILIFMSIYKISYLCTNTIMRKSRRIKNIKVILRLLFYSSILCAIIIVTLVGINNLFTRSTNHLNITSSSIALIISNTLRAIPVFFVALNLLYYRKNNCFYRPLAFFSGVIIMMLTNFPTATARFWMVSVYLGLFLIVMQKSRNPYFLKNIILVGMIVVFPTINIFRRNSFSQAISLGFHIPKLSDLFTYGDFDSYSMLVRVLIYVNERGIRWGRQLLGNVLFFIPRSLWNSKPLGSGVMLANELNWPFTNVSCSYIGEGYINFGIMGVFAFACILGFLSKIGDVKYRETIFNNDSTIKFIEIIYPFTLGFLFFILRGDLLSSLSYYIGFLMPVLLIYIVQTINMKGHR